MARQSFSKPSCPAICLALLLFAAPAAAQLRVVSYNTNRGPRTGMSTVLEAIGEELVGGVAKPIDVLVLQEQDNPATTTQAIADLLNGIYGAGTYARGTRVGTPTSASIRQSVVYNTQTVSLINDLGIGGPSSTTMPRQLIRHQFRPVGYDSSADFYIYNSHYLAGNEGSSSNGTTVGARRLFEATFIRGHSDATLGEGAHVIYAGDFNMDSSNEAAYQQLLSSGPGQAFDPVNQPGRWNNNSSFARWHTQSPCENACSGGLVGGGVDDRFDFQLVTGELLDNEGLSYLNGSYRTFGNNGSTYNDAINVGNTISFSGITSFTKTQVLNALATATDHLPVVADYQLPAVLDTLVEMIPSTLQLGELFDLGVTVFNAADVVAEIGADELDYTLTTTGDLSGAFTDTDFALGGGNLHDILFDTSSPGEKSGSIVIESTSQSAANSLVTIPVNYQVLAPTLAGDFNGDGFVDAADYTVWRDGGPLLNETASIGEVDADDYTEWAANYGATSDVSSTAVPEPAGVLLLSLGLITAGRRRR